MNFKEENITYQQIGEIMLEVLRDEGEELDFLSDYSDYCLCRIEMDDDAIGDIAILQWRIQDTPEYKQLLRVFHTLVLEYTRGEFQPYCTIAHFLGEGFNRFHCSLEKK